MKIHSKRNISYLISQILVVNLHETIIGLSQRILI
jgi:hypothetical protein